MVLGALRSRRAQGIAIAGLGVFVLSPESVVIRLISVDEWTILLWRGWLMSVGLLALVGITSRGGTVRAIKSIGWPGILASVLFAADNVLFVVAITHTSVANTLLILSSAPLFAVVLSVIFLDERADRRTWLAVAVAAIAVAIIFSGGMGERSPLGDLAALGAAVSIAGTLVVLRGARAKNMVPSMALGAFFVGVVVFVRVDPFAVAGRDLWFLLLLGLVISPVAWGLITVGTRYIPAHEVGLLILVEAVLGPLWAWMVLREMPSPETLLGGLVLLGTLVAYFRGQMHVSEPGVFVE